MSADSAHLHSVATEKKRVNDASEFQIDMEPLDSDDVEEPNVIKPPPSNPQLIQPRYPSRNRGPPD